MEPFIQVLEVVRGSGLLEKYDVDVAARIADVQEQVRTVAARYYGQKRQELHATPGVNRALPQLLMTDEIEKAAKLLDKRFPEPLLGYACVLVSCVCWICLMGRQPTGHRLISRRGPGAHFHYGPGRVAETTVRRFDEWAYTGCADSGHLRALQTHEDPDGHAQGICTEVRTIHYQCICVFSREICSGDIQFDLVGFFQPYIQQWLVNTDNKTTQWVQAVSSYPLCDEQTY